MRIIEIQNRCCCNIKCFVLCAYIVSGVCQGIKTPVNTPVPMWTKSQVNFEIVLEPISYHTKMPYIRTLYSLYVIKLKMHFTHYGEHENFCSENSVSLPTNKSILVKRSRKHISFYPVGVVVVVVLVI